jgi:hypothetical protein
VCNSGFLKTDNVCIAELNVFQQVFFNFISHADFSSTPGTPSPANELAAIASILSENFDYVTLEIGGLEDAIGAIAELTPFETNDAVPLKQVHV